MIDFTGVVLSMRILSAVSRQRVTAVNLLALCCFPGVALAQRPGTPPADGVTQVAATHAEKAPVIDGRDDDAVWQHATAMTDFRVARPSEGAKPGVRTEARFAYDAHYLYVFVRAFDPHPDSIVSLLARRDAMTPSDEIMVVVDSYHDRRTGYEFWVNPAGVKLDQAVSQDGNEDPAWDGIWDVATRTDSLGWTAEFRLPLSQMRYVASASNTFGIGVWRIVERTTEQSTWPLYRVSRPGFMSQLGELTGLDGLEAPHRVEVAPYGVARNISMPNGNGFNRAQRFEAGADFKLGVGSGMMVTGTVNPDFGQVEADPAVLNLSAFETFFPEQRPFFVEGSGLFQFNVDCSAVNCNNEQLFYSRRIGRAPQLGGSYGDATSPTATTILGAAKLTGQPAPGLTIGVIDAVTQRETGVAGATIEPTTNYSVVRATQDFNGGASGIGLMLTGVNRSLDQWTQSALDNEAYSGALEFRYGFLNRRYQISGSLDLSRVAGSAAAIAAIQRDPVHLYQRPDGPLVYDSLSTSLTGDAEEIHIGKTSGRRLMFETSYLRRSPGFEINDLGFLLQADQQSWNNWAGLTFNHPNRAFLSLRWNFNWWQYWSAAGLPTERAANTNTHIQLANRWWLHAGGTVGQVGTTWCDRCARGGPAVRQDPYIAPWVQIQGDDRHRLIPSLAANYYESSNGRNSSLSVSPQLKLNVSSRVSANFGVSASNNVTDNQYYGTFTDGTGAPHYTFAHLDQQTVSLTADLGYTFTPALTVQWHLEPFISRGTFTNLREIGDAGAADYDARYRPYADTSLTNNLGGVDSKQFNSNMVVRWEYRPGSTLFLVWTQGRNSFDPQAGPDGVRGDLRDLFRLRADNTFLVKVSYWLGQ
ncbi:MAG TPA: DUF5916 domain-containing protein [Gemmatimonadales bacterium]